MEKKIDFSQVLSTLSGIKLEICHLIDSKKLILDTLRASKKADGTIVTEIDLYISDLFKEKFLDLYPFLSFYSEEDHEDFKYPMIILDPIDGTKELAKGIEQCAVSFGIYYSGNLSDSRNFSWIFNPFTKFCIDSTVDIDTLLDLKSEYKGLLGLVSNTEYKNKLFNKSADFKLRPVGSIAYKLGLLASNNCDFVITKRPKSIWDIMAGSHICYLLGISMYVGGNKIEDLSSVVIDPIIIWSKDKNIPTLLTYFQK